MQQVSGEEIWKASRVGDIQVLREIKEDNVPSQCLEWRDATSGRTPLMVAAVAGRLECVQILIDTGAININAKDSGAEGNTALHYAATSGHLAIVQTLLRHSACNPFLWNQRGCSALDAARLRQTFSPELQVQECIRVLEDRFILHSGWLFHSARNSVSKAAGLSELNTWNKRYCRILRTGTDDYVQVAFYKTEESSCPTFVFWCRIFDPVIEGSSDKKWFNTKPHTFRISGCIKKVDSTSPLGDPTTLELAALSPGTYVTWIDFFKTKTREIQPLKTTSDQVKADVADDLSQEEIALQQAMALSWQMSQGVVESKPPAAPVLRSSIVPPAPSSTKEETTTTSIGDDCVICMEEKQTAVCVPCGHNAACVECLQDVKSSTGICPVCRAEIREIVRLYKA